MTAEILQFQSLKGKVNEFIEINDERWQWVLPIHILYADALMLVSQIALALKHPQNNGMPAEAAREWGKAIVERLMADIPEFTPDLVRMFGYDKVFGLDLG